MEHQDHDQDLPKRLEKIERRLDRLEAHLQIEREPQIEPEPPAEPQVAPPSPPAAPAPPPPPPPRPLAPPTRPQTPVAPPKPPIPVAPVTPVTPAAPAGPRRAPLEFLVGAKVMAWAGALVVVLAVAFFLRHAFQEGWISETLRCLLGAAFGGLLIAAGEYTRKKIGRLGSVGLYAAGLTSLYMVAWAAHVRYDVIGQEASFVFMGLIALAGFAMTVRTRFKTIGVLSTLGAYAVPALLAGSSGHDLEVLTYFTVILGVALALSATIPSEFRLIRYVASGAHAINALAWVAFADGDLWIMAIVFFSIWWTMMLVECTLAALRDQSRVGNIVATLLATAAYVSAGTWILAGLAPAGFDWLGAFTAAIAVLGIVVAFQFGPGIDALRGRLRSPMDQLALALWAQSGVLVAVAVALQFDGYGQAVAWLAVALAAIEMARRLPSRGVGIFGLIVGGLALVRIALYDFPFNSALRATLVDVSLGDLLITGRTLLGLLAVAACALGAWRLVPGRGFRGWPIMAPLLAALATFGWLGVAAGSSGGLTTTTLWLAAVLVLFALRRIDPGLRLFELGLVGLLVTGGRWLLVNAALPRLDARWSAGDALPILNPQMALAAAIAATGVWAFRTMNRRAALAGEHDLRAEPTHAVAAQVIVIGAAMFFLVAMSFQVDLLVVRTSGQALWSVDHVRQLALSVLWALGALGLGVLARPFRAARALSTTAWIVLAAVAAKFVVIDTLYYAFDLRTHTLDLAPVLNLQVLAAGVIGAAALVLGSRSDLPVREWMPLAASLLLLWALSFEVDRIIGRQEAANVFTLWPSGQHRALWWTALWAVGGLCMQLVGRWRSIRLLQSGGWAIVSLAAVAWLTIDTIGFRLSHGAIQVSAILNLQFGVGATLITTLVTGVLLLPPAADEPRRLRRSRELITGCVLVGAIVLWLGTLEIDRALNDQALLAALSVFWTVYATALVAVGFMRRVAVVRYVGLALLSVTVVKVLLIDMHEVETLWRIASFVISGALLLAVSIVYSRLAPRFLPR